jgi:hypothetical protein
MTPTRWPHRVRRSTRRALTLEALEDRTLLSVIAWTNRGSPGNDSDDFEKYYGAAADSARQVVDAAIAYWENVIVDFGYVYFWINNSIQKVHMDVYSVDISADSLGSGDRGETDNPDADLIGKPYQTDISLDDNGGGAGWFFDPTPGDSVEFGNIVNRSTATGGPAAADFLRTAVHELGHALGFSQNLAIDSYLTSAGTDQVDSDASLYLYTPPGNAFPSATFTDKGGLHMYEGPADPNFSSEPIHPNDLMNAGRTYTAGKRQLISDLDAGILGEVYGYTIQLPSSIPQFSFLAQFNAGTGVLTVNGDPEGFVNDAIVLKKGPGNNVNVNVIGDDLLFPAAPITAITVQTGVVLDGDDVVTLDLSGGNPIPAGSTFTVNGGAGNNTVAFFGTTNPDTYVLNAAQLDVGGMSVAYAFQNVGTVYLQAQGQGNTIRVDDTPAGATYSYIVAGTDNDIVDVEGTSAGCTLEVFGGMGDDTVYVSFIAADLDNIHSPLLLHRGSDTDTLWVEDQLAPVGHNYDITDQSITRDGVSIGYDGFESVQLDASGGTNTIKVESTLFGTYVLVHAGTGDSQITVGKNVSGSGSTVDYIRGPLAIHGQGGTDNLLTDDRTDPIGATVTITASTVGAGFGDSYFGVGGSLEYEQMNTLTVDTGGGNDSINVVSTAAGTPTTINAGRGDDHILVGGGGREGSGRLGGVVDGIVSPLVVNGQAGSNYLIVDDSLDPTGDVVTVTPTQVGADPGDTFFGPGGKLTYSSIYSLALYAGIDADTIWLRGTAPGTALVYLNGGAGGDAIAVDSNGAASGGLVNGLNSALTVNGGGQSGDRLTLENIGAQMTQTATVTGTQVGAAIGDSLWNAGASLTYGGLGQLTLDAGQAGDFLYVAGTAAGTATTIDAGGGNDVVRIDSKGPVPGGVLDQVVSPLTVNGQAGTNALTLDDSGSAIGDQATLTPSTLGAGAADTLFGAGGSLAYNGFGFLTLNLGSGSDLVTVEGTAPGTTTTLNDGAGIDQVVVDSNGPVPGGSVDGVRSKLTVHGQGGGDRLALMDLDDPSGDHVTITPTQVGATPGDTFFGAGGTLTYDGLSLLVLQGGSGGNFINVRGTAAGTNTLIAAGAGADTVLVDSNGTASGGTVDGVVSLLAINGGAGVNRLILEDSSDATGDTLTVTGSQVGAAPGDNYFGPGGSLGYNNFAQLTVRGGSGGNTITITGTANGTDTAVFAGAGSDQIAVDSNGVAPGGTVDGVMSTLTIHGGGGVNRLLLEDSSDASADTVTITDRQVGAFSTDNFFGTNGSLSYDSLSQLTLDGGSGGNTLIVLSKAAGTTTILNTGTGSDTIQVHVTTASAYHNLFVNGGQPNAGSGDTLQILDDSGGGLVTNHPNGPGSGYVQVDYGGGILSRIDYTGIETLIL